jgi:hypothetical protein
MKRSVLFLVCAGFFPALPLSMAGMNNQDIIKMHKAGLAEETILAAMQKETPEYDTGTDALIELKSAGISEPVIQAMIKLDSPAASAPAAAPSPAAEASSSSGSGDAFWQDFPSITPPRIEPTAGKDYFTRYTFREEKNQHRTTNYARGLIVPINTPVKLISMSGSKLVLKRLDTGQEIKVENEEKFTKKSISEIAALMLSAEKTPLERLPDAVALAIRNGDMRKGMTREVVLMARGYPPAHETPSIDSDRWVFWSSRFVKQTVVFVNGRLSEGRGLY